MEAAKLYPGASDPEMMVRIYYDGEYLPSEGSLSLTPQQALVTGSEQQIDDISHAIRTSDEPDEIQF